MFANGAAQLDLKLGLGAGAGAGAGVVGGAWVTLVDLSDEILCSLCLRGQRAQSGVLCVGRFALASGEACASQVNFQITTKRSNGHERQTDSGTAG